MYLELVKCENECVTSVCAKGHFLESKKKLGFAPVIKGAHSPCFYCIFFIFVLFIIAITSGAIYKCKHIMHLCFTIL